MAVTIHNKGCTFSVWAPEKQEMKLHLVTDERIIDMQKDAAGYFHCTVNNIHPGTRYCYQPVKAKITLTGIPLSAAWYARPFRSGGSWRL